jgi:hypothetical protein
MVQFIKFHSPETKNMKLFLLRFSKLQMLFCGLFLAVNVANSQQVSSASLKQPWKAQWIAGPDREGPGKDFVVLLFRKVVVLDSVRGVFPVHVSADNRYKLFVNEKLVSLGPARGDLYHWKYETVDIGPFLKKGRNIIAAHVWNFGELRPAAQISYRTGFILQGGSRAAEILNTDTTWRVSTDTSYQLLQNRVPGYYVAGPGEFVTMAKQQKGWLGTDFSDSAWKPAQVVAPGHTKRTIYDSPAWMLVPSQIPPMQLSYERLVSLRKASGVSVPAGFPAQKVPLTIPSHTKASLLLDRAVLTNAYPTLSFSGGKGAGISLRYAEALFIPDTAKWDTTKGGPPRFRIAGKGNRNEVDGKIFIGTRDSTLSDGTANQIFTTLWWRTYRYLEVRVETGEEPLVINDLYGTFTGYPFSNNAAFKTDDPLLKQVLEIGWRTARLCAWETYMDCPYYEQLQYIGDTRIQALVSLYNSGDDRLLRNALTQFDQSRIAEGITQSRWPSAIPQQIPTFSLWHIGMLYDYSMYGNDSVFVNEKLPGVRQILSWFNAFQGRDGSLVAVPYWNFTDWLNRKGWVYGMPPTGKNGESAILDMQLMWAYQLASAMEKRGGLAELGRLYQARALQLKTTVQLKYWDSKRKLYADTEGKDLFSQHTNSLAVLTGVVSGNEATGVAKRLLADTSLAPASIYFKYYLHQALTKAGLGNDYLNWLDVWKENIRMGLTTWAETSDVNGSRSDCHAWGSSPNVEFFRTVLGIDTDAPGFKKVKIQPHLGSLKEASGEIPHPLGKFPLVTG